MLKRRKGFTLIELLVVIAIIGILASMVFPVFARARESARKIVCLSNVKNLATAVQMYLADNNDTMPPGEERPEVLAYFDTCPGGKTYTASLEHCNRARQMNPYLRMPVMLDEYVKNRDVWRCKSARMEGGCIYVIGFPDWFQYVVDNEGSWGTGNTYLKPCALVFPKGWGGTVTDTLIQARTATGAPKAFIQSIGMMQLFGLKLGTIEDPVNYVVVGDAGCTIDDFCIGSLAYPDICCLECSGVCGWADWTNSTCIDYGRYCGLYDTAPNDGSFLMNAELRKQYARHLGGVNVGFMDGHAAFWNSEALVTGVRDGTLPAPQPWGPTSADDSWVSSCFPNSVYIW
jgi:prepilin-type N-terminal cleavage/methylation domain-containing protein/prepilin-type processing-associated H-X9-DG protein